jgi:exopolysaccharide production protein ExoQ
MSSGGHLLTPVGEPYLRVDGLRLPPAARNHQRAKPLLQPLIDFDGFLYFIMLLSLLFINKLATYGAFVFIVTASAFIYRNRPALRIVFHEQWLFLLLPLLAIASSLWSDVPADTLKHSLEFFLTAITGLMIPAGKNQRSLIYAMFAAFGLYIAFSLALGDMVHVGTTQETALSGMAGSKNEEGSTAATGAIVTLLWFSLGIQTRCYFQSLAAVAVGLVEVYATYLAHSAGALASLAVASTLFLLLAMLSKAGRRLKVAVVGFGGVAALTIGMIFLTFTSQIVEALSAAFDKDVTLTGRTYLWARARDLVAEHPLLGRGYDAFWQQGNLDAEGLWQYAHIKSRSGFNFHNTSYDILVSLGWIGMTLFALLLIIGLCKVAGAYVRKPSLLACFWLSMAGFLIVRMPVETSGSYEFSYPTILLFAIFGFGFLSSRRQALHQAWRTVAYEGATPRSHGSYVL